jgi:hypothetical protein
VTDPDPVNRDGLHALAEAMKARIDHLGLTSLEINDRGGPSRGALREILNARRVPRKSTLADIDLVLGWPTGVAQELLDGSRTAPEPDQWLHLPDENRLGLIRSRLFHLRKEHHRISDTHQQFGQVISDLLQLIEEIH